MSVTRPTLIASPAGAVVAPPPASVAVSAVAGRLLVVAAAAGEREQRQDGGRAGPHDPPVAHKAVGTGRGGFRNPAPSGEEPPARDGRRGRLGDLDLAGRDLRPKAQESPAPRGLNPRGEPAVADTTVLDRVRRVDAAAERRAGLARQLDGGEHRDIDLLRRAHQHVLAEVTLVGVHADAEDVLLLRRVERAEAASARRPGRRPWRRFDVVAAPAPCTSPGRRSPVSSCASTFTCGYAFFAALVVAAEEAVDRRQLLPADRSDHTRAVRDVLRLQPGEVADEVAGLLLLEE